MNEAQSGMLSLTNVISVGLCIIVSLFAAQIDHTQLLQKAIGNVSSNSGRLQRFSCSESVVRSSYTSANGQRSSQPDRKMVLAWTDQFRLEFAVFKGRQLFSWPGLRAFEYESPGSLIGAGASTSGEFGPFAISIVISDSTSVEFRELHTEGIRKVAEYGYKVPRDRSHFLVATGVNKATPTPFQASFFVDAETGDMVRLVVDVDNAPAESGMRSGRTTIEYQHVRIGANVTSLPVRAETDVVSEGGDISVNKTSYQDCKEFTSSSTVRFDGTAETEAQISPVQGLSTPPGLKVWTKFLTMIDARQSFAGDAFEAEVVKPVMLDKQVLISKGSKLMGRIVLLRRRFFPTRQFVVQIKFDNVTGNGNISPISLMSLGPSGVYQAEDPDTPENAVTPRGNSGVATITVFGSDSRTFKPGTEWLWQTQSPSPN